MKPFYYYVTYSVFIIVSKEICWNTFSCFGFMWDTYIFIKLHMDDLLYPHTRKLLGGYIGFTSSVRPSVRLLEDKLYYWKINCNIGRSVVFSEDQLYWRQSTRIDGNYRSRKITARRWLHKYVGAECRASSFTRCLYQMYNTDVRPSEYPCALRVPRTSPHGFLSSLVIQSLWICCLRMMGISVK